MDAAVRHPTIRREKTSETNAVNTMPDRVETWGKSTTHNCFGFSAVNRRSTRSGGCAAECCPSAPPSRA